MQDNSGRTSLIAASLNGQTETALQLLQKAADVNIQDRSGYSSLIAAIMKGHGEIVSLLIQNGASIDIQNNSGWSSLMMASHNGHAGVVSPLLHSGANTNLCEKLIDQKEAKYNGTTALILATSVTETRIAFQLLDFGADTSMANSSGESALSIAAQCNLKTVVEKIIEKTLPIDLLALLNHKDVNGKTPLMLASCHGHIEVAEMLLKAGASTESNLPFPSHLQPQHINFPVDINTVKASALDFAVLQGNTEMVTLLLQYSAKIDDVYCLFNCIMLKLAQERLGGFPKDIINKMFRKSFTKSYARPRT